MRYLEPEMEMVEFETVDVITESLNPGTGTGNGGSTGESGTGPDIPVSP